MKELCYIGLVLEQKITTATAFKLIDDQVITDNPRFRRTNNLTMNMRLTSGNMK